jgi:selenocysteine lyase/cysteine desulfurase
MYNKLKTGMKGPASGITEVFWELERSVYAALETYSNVHRGSGHYSMVSTALFEQAREIVREHLGLNDKDYVVIFCTPHPPGNLQGPVEDN